MKFKYLLSNDNRLFKILLQDSSVKLLVTRLKNLNDEKPGGLNKKIASKLFTCNITKKIRSKNRHSIKLRILFRHYEEVICDRRKSIAMVFD